MHQRRYGPVGIDLEVRGLVLIELQKVEIVAFVGHALLGQGEHRLARVRIRFPVIQRKHRRIPSSQPRPMYGIFVAMIVMNLTLASRGSCAICSTALPTSSTS